MITDWAIYYQQNKHLPLSKIMENYRRLLYDYFERKLYWIAQANAAVTAPTAGSGGSAPISPDTFLPFIYAPTNISTNDVISKFGWFVHQSANGLSGITSMTWDRLTYNFEGIDIENCQDLVSVSFPVLTGIADVGYLHISGCPNLTTIDIPILSICHNIYFAQNALSAQSVAKILNNLVANGWSNSVLNISGGTNAAPDTSPGSDYTVLISRGNTINHN